MVRHTLGAPTGVQIAAGTLTFAVAKTKWELNLWSRLLIPIGREVPGKLFSKKIISPWKNFAHEFSCLTEFVPNSEMFSLKLENNQRKAGEIASRSKKEGPRV